MLRVAIADDHPIARHGLRAMLEQSLTIHVTACVGDLASLPYVAPNVPDADLVLLDLYMTADRPALQEIRAISVHRPVLVVSASGAPADVLAAVQAGASGYLSKQATAADYLAAVEEVAAGGFHLSSQLADSIQATVIGDPKPPPRQELSPREQETLSMIARGFTHQQAATRMGVSPATVDTYIARIRAKLQLGNKAQLTLAALRYLQRPPRR